MSTIAARAAALATNDPADRAKAAALHKLLARLAALDDYSAVDPADAAELASFYKPGAVPECLRGNLGADRGRRLGRDAGLPDCLNTADVDHALDRHRRHRKVIEQRDNLARRLAVEPTPLELSTTLAAVKADLEPKIAAMQAQITAAESALADRRQSDEALRHAEQAVVQTRGQCAWAFATPKTTTPPRTP